MRRGRPDTVWAGTGEVWVRNSVSVGDGVYNIDPDGGGPIGAYDVYCDMTTDGGGWTLVGSTNNTTFDDAGTSTWYADLTTVNPASGHSEIWDGLRDYIGPAGDIGSVYNSSLSCRPRIMCSPSGVASTPRTSEKTDCVRT